MFWLLFYFVWRERRGYFWCVVRNPDNVAVHLPHSWRGSRHPSSPLSHPEMPFWWPDCLNRRWQRSALEINRKFSMPQALQDFSSGALPTWSSRWGSFYLSAFVLKQLGIFVLKYLRMFCSTKVSSFCTHVFVLYYICVWCLSVGFFVRLGLSTPHILYSGFIFAVSRLFSPHHTVYHVFFVFP